MNRSVRIVTMGLIAAGLMIVAFAVYVQNGLVTRPLPKTPTAVKTTFTPSAEAKAQEDLNAQVTTADVPKGTPASQSAIKLKVYFSHHSESDEDPSRIFGVVRTAHTVGVGTFAVQQLINGPSAEELAHDYFSNIVLSGESNCGKDFLLSIVNQTATLKFCKQFMLKGVISDGQAKSQITTTLSQFSTIKKVVILSSTGSCLFDESGQDLCKK